MVDLHTHVLPGIDDGVRSLDEAVDLAAGAAAEGVRTLAGTPHVSAHYPTAPAAMEAACAQVQQALAERGVAVELVSGGELDLEWLARLDDEEVLRFSYGGRGSYALLEIPEGAWPRALEPALGRLRRLGLRAVLAHPERNTAVQDRPEVLRAFVDEGAVVQVTGLALLGKQGGTVNRAAGQLVRTGLAHAIASDAHGPQVREYALGAAAAAVGDEALARYLLDEAPAAIVAGEAVSAPPVRRRRRRLFGVR